MRTQTHALCPMPDGVRLSCDLYLPDAPGRYPAVLMRTPYGKQSIFSEAVYSKPELLTGAGYAVVIQDVRGTGESEGVLKSTGENEYQDGYESVEWVAAQPFCDGRVGMYGLSYFGFTQLSAASRRPPHLLAICPFQTVSQEPYGGTRMRTLNGFHMFWIYGQAIGRVQQTVKDPQRRAEILGTLEENRKRLPELLLHRPLCEMPAAFVQDVPQLLDYIDLVRGIEQNAFWERIHRPMDFSRMHTAMFHLTGWFDMERNRTIDSYHAALRAADDYTRQRQKLVIGPWGHGGGLHTIHDGYDYGAQNSGEEQGIAGEMRRWFDQHLKGITPAKEEKPVRYFVLGENRWHTDEAWPPARAVRREWHLNAKGQLLDVPGETESADGFVYDPAHPYPSDYRDAQGRQALADQRALSQRADVLCYETEPLARQLTLAGNGVLTLYAATDAPDTDFVCQVVEVYPDGLEFPLLRGLVRAKYRDGATLAPVRPHAVTAYAIDLGNLALRIQAGHRLKIHVTSSLYPMHDANPNTGLPVGDNVELRVARQQIFHGGEYPSRLSLCTLPAEGE